MAQNKSFKIYKILLLEDDPDSAEIVTRSLEKYNIQIDHVNNARLAINKLKTKYDLIISDVMMPVMDGFSFIEKYKQEIHNTPVIIVTALKEKEDILKAHRKHAYQLMANELKIPHLVVSLCYSGLQLILSALVIFAPFYSLLFVILLAIVYVAFKFRYFSLHTS